MTNPPIDINLLTYYLRNLITVVGNTLLVLAFTGAKRSKRAKILYISAGILISLIISAWFFHPSDQMEFVSVAMILCCLLVSSTFVFYVKDGFFQTVLNIFTQLNICFIISYFAYILSNALFLQNIWAEICIRTILYVMIIAICHLYLQKPYRAYIKHIQKGWISLAVIACGFSILFTFVFLLPIPFYEREPYNDYICIGSIILFILVYAMCIFNFNQIVKNINKEMILTQQEQQFRNLKRQLITYKRNTAAVKELRHDLHHHDTVLLQLLKNGEIEKARHFLEEHGARISQAHTTIYCRNTIVNSVFSTYANVASDKGYPIQIIANIPETIEIQSVDIASLLSNIMENAIEACDKVKSGSPFMDMQCDYSREALRITLRNSSDEAPQFIDGIPQTTKTNGGIGCQSVLSVVNKYDGLVSFHWEAGVFTTKIMLREIAKDPSENEESIPID